MDKDFATRPAVEDHHVRRIAGAARGVGREHDVSNLSTNHGFFPGWIVDVSRDAFIYSKEQLLVPVGTTHTPGIVRGR